MHADEASVNEQPPEEYDEEAEAGRRQSSRLLFSKPWESMRKPYVREEREEGSLVFEIEGSDAGTADRPAAVRRSTLCSSWCG